MQYWQNKFTDIRVNKNNYKYNKVKGIYIKYSTISHFLYKYYY